jgi:hypothetical protein
MSIDHYYTKIDGRWVRTNMRVVNGKWEYIPEDEIPDFHTDFWVDICHGGNGLIDERYYFADLASALDFYLRGWKERQYLDDDGKEMGLDKRGLYSQERLIHGLSIYDDAPGDAGKSLQQIREQFARRVGEDQT